MERKKYCLVHYYHETCKEVIVCFSNSEFELRSIMLDNPRFGSQRHSFSIIENNSKPNAALINLDIVKDENLISMCKNVAQYLSFGEFSMLKHSYIKASIWFERAKDSAVLAADILENY